MKIKKRELHEDETKMIKLQKLKYSFFTLSILFSLLLGLNYPTLELPIQKNLVEQSPMSSYELISPIVITSDTEFAAHSSSGDGSPKSPWVIENKDINLYGTFEHGIVIMDTEDYFIIRNCRIFNPWPWSANGMAFTNVKNGEIQENFFSPYPILLYYIYPSIVALNLFQCENMNITGNFIAPSFYYGLLMHQCSSISVSGNYFNAYIDICATDTVDSTIMYNQISGRYDALEELNNLAIGIYFSDCYDNRIESNIIENYKTYGIQLDMCSENNIIVENSFSTPVSSISPIIETNDAGPNYYFDVMLPEEAATFTGPEAPSPGWYPGTIGWDDWSIGEIIGGDFQVQGTTGHEGIVIESKKDTGGNDHKMIAKLFTGNEISPYISLSLDKRVEETVSFGVCEFWFLMNNPTNDGDLSFPFTNNAGDSLFEIKVEDNSLKFLSNSTLIDTGIQIINNEWYRISVEFSDEETDLLDPHTYRFRVMDASGRKVVYSSPIALYTNHGTLRKFITNAEGGSSNMTVYLDAIGYSWSYGGYKPDDNKDAGIIVSYKIQEFSILYSWFWDYSIDGITKKSETVRGEDTKTFIIPVPSDGEHTLIFQGQTLAPYLLEKTITSKPVHFSTYYTSNLEIGVHEENNLIVAEETEVSSVGVVGLSESLPLKIDLTDISTSYITTENLTWTNVSLFFKTNNEMWQGPFNMGYDDGLMNGSFTIDSGNYTSFDHLYYYITLDQYDDTSQYLDTFYWTSDGIVKCNELLARDLAFHKKVAPVLFELSLTYGVWYKSQVERVFLSEDELVPVSIYPWVRITNENFTIDFLNQTDDLTYYKVLTDSNLIKLNHSHYSDTSNITSDSPAITLEEGLKDPFAIRTDLPLVAHTSHILLPNMMFDSLNPGNNLTFTDPYLDLEYKGSENWPSEKRKVMKFSNGADDVVIRYDFYTGIMVYFHYIDKTTNAGEKIVFGLISNNNSYPIDLTVDIRPEVVDENTTIIPNYLFAIVYDPPGDQSYSQISSGTSLTLGMGMENTDTSGFHMETEVYGMGVGGGIDLTTTTTDSDAYDTEMTITFEQTITSSIESEDPDYIGPGRGDVYVLSGLIIHYRFIVNNVYIVRETPDAPNNSTDDIKVWENGSRVEYSPGIESTITVTGAVLDQYGLKSLELHNPFVDNYLSDQELALVEEEASSPVFFTPNYFSEMISTYTTSTTRSTSTILEMSLDTFMAWDVETSAGLIVEQTVFKSTGKIGMVMDTSTTTTSTTSLESNKEILCHLEDDDGTPVGEHDQFLVSVYKDLRWNTFGFIVDEDLTFTSQPHEYNSRDRRSPPPAIIFAVDEYIGGEFLLSSTAIDDETGINHVRYYIDDDPTFDLVFIDVDGIYLEDFDSIPGYIGYTDTPSVSDSDVYEFIFDSNTYQGKYYLFSVVYDNAFPIRNYKVSAPFLVHIDNVDPETCIIRAYGPYRETISLFSTTFDADSGVDHVEYWLGDPEISGSRWLGVGADASSSYNFVWPTDPGGNDDGIHQIYARSFDKAGNFLTSTPISVDVNNNLDFDGDLLSDEAEINIHGTNPNSNDTDDDGLSDFDEIFIYSTNPLLNDSDGDTLGDFYETENELNPNSRDTDGDGYSDDVEIAQGSAANDAQSIPEEAPNVVDTMSIISNFGAIGIAILAIVMVNVKKKPV